MQTCGTKINTITTPQSSNGVSSISMEDYVKMKERQEDQIDYQFIQRVIQELTQSCALPLPIPASAIPPLILQAAQYFWQNDDQSTEERYFCLPRSQFNKCGPNLTVKLPSQIISVFGVFKTTGNFNYGAMGDFSLERMILNNNMLASGAGGTMADAFGTGYGYSLTDITASLYEVSTYKAMFDTPLTYNYNEFSNELVILGALGNSDLVLQTFMRLKLQDLYKNYYFFRYVIGLGLKSMATIIGTYDFKLAGGVSINWSRFHDMGENEINKVEEWVNKNHACDYFLQSATI